MSLKHVMEVYDLLDDPGVDGNKVRDYLLKSGAKHVKVTRVEGSEGYTDFVKIIIPGNNGKMRDGNAPTLGIIGRLGGIGARPEAIGLVSDGDGAVAAIAIAAKIGEMNKRGDVLPGDVIIGTHICPFAPTLPHEPVPFMGSPVDMDVMNRYEVDEKMDAILSIDTTKGNRIINFNGFAISPTVKEGYILKVSEDLLDIIQITTGRLPRVFAISEQDITPYGNGLFHINSIMQPSVATSSPVVGIAITTEMPVPGCASGASHVTDIEEVVRFVIEVAKNFGYGKCAFYDRNEFEKIIELYGEMNRFQKKGDLNE
ncbi:MAG: DUF1177 domain-containing protein [Thermoanaerobacteraceae bacterium]|nr:DUF1177 domain-containing protein [Thermoanaerobacteraceae bacterium]